MSEARAEPTPLSDQDKIRLKRIARLQQPPALSQPTLEVPTGVPGPSSILTQSPSAKSEVVPKNNHGRNSADSARVAAPLAPQVSGSGLANDPRQSDEDWEDCTITRVLNVTLNMQVAADSNWSVTYLKEVAEELAVENTNSSASLKLCSEWLDRLLLARLSLSPLDVVDDPEMATVLASFPLNQTLFEYLAGCWRRERAERTRSINRKHVEEARGNQQLKCLDMLKNLIVSYMGLVLIDPTLFPQDFVQGKKLGASELFAIIRPSSATSTSIRNLQTSDLPTLLQDIAYRFSPMSSTDNDGGLEIIMDGFIAEAAAALLLSKSDISGGGNSEVSWRDTLNALQMITEQKSVAECIPLSKRWSVAHTPGITAASFESFCLLGPFLRLSTFPDAFPTIAEAYFPDPETMRRSDTDGASASLRGTLTQVQHSLFNILNNMVRASTTSREAVLSLLGDIASMNVKRAAMRVESGTVSTHGFIINCHSALISFALPFTDGQFSKIDKIDISYYRNSARIDIADETKINADQSESSAYYAGKDRDAGKPPNFISEIFFLCCAFFRIGPLHAIKEHKGITQQIQHMKRQLDEMEADSTWRGTPNEATTQAHIDRYRKKRNVFSSQLLAYEVQLLDSAYLSSCIGFLNLGMAWLVRAVDPTHKHPQTRISLPLPAKVPDAFRFLPEYIIENITEFITYVSKYAPEVLNERPQEELMTFMLVFLSTPYMKNPYLKGQFIEIMYFLTRPIPGYPKGCLGDTLNFHSLALRNLMPCLIHVYVQIESTGSHTQFYDKFNTRYYITQLFKLVWSNPSHREALKSESGNLDQYVRFANLLMNDTTFLISEALDHLGKIHELQKQMDDETAWAARPATERQEQEKLLRQYENTARSDIDLGHESLRLLLRFAGETRDPFLTPEIVDRLAAMLDMNLSMLAGPRCQDLKVKEPEKYKFRPKELLSDLLQIYLELGSRAEFQSAVARDGRSYSKDLFTRAERIARKTSIKTDVELEVIQQMVNAVERIKAAEEEDDAMGEVPDEYLDPLTYEIMRDPVILPSSKTVVDRSTIKQHYLSDATDPFNRVPLKWEDIIEADELKQQIIDFLEKRRLNRAAPLIVTLNESSAVSRQMDIDL